MRKEERFRRYEKASRAAKPEQSQHKPGSCKRCCYYRPDFKYRRCQFSRCPYDARKAVFRKNPLKRDKFSPEGRW